MRFLVLAGCLVGGLAMGGMQMASGADEFSPLDGEERPKCEKATRTQFWPEEANSNGRAAMRLAREGKLLICTRGAWKYAWRPVAMNLRAAVEEERAKEKR